LNLDDLDYLAGSCDPANQCEPASASNHIQIYRSSRLSAHDCCCSLPSASRTVSADSLFVVGRAYY
jgi:hypothetical protein